MAKIISIILEELFGEFAAVGKELIEEIFSAMIGWMYEQVFGAIADFFELMGKMGAEIFDLEWIEATIEIFRIFGWTLYSVGLIVAIFDLAMEYQNGKADIKSVSINILKGFFACSLITTVPVELYRFCISLQNTFSHDIARVYGLSKKYEFDEICKMALKNVFDTEKADNISLFSLIVLIAFAYCIVKVFFANIKRGGILLIQIAVGSLYMFSMPRGYADGFTQWCKQVIATCLTAFLQTTLLYLGLMTFIDNMLLGLGVMLAANEVPRIAQQFGLDSSVKFNAMSAIYTTNTAVNLTRNVTKLIK